MAFTISDFEQYKKASKKGNKKLAAMWAGKMIKANDRLIRKLVLKYSKHLPDSIDKEDLLQAGYVGVMRLFERLDFIDPNRQVSTLLAFYIRSEIGKLAERNPVVRKPIASTMPWKMQSKAIVLRAQGVEPTAELLGVSERLWDVWARATPRLEEAHEDSLGCEGDPETILSDRQQKSRILLALSGLEPPVRDVIVRLYSEDAPSVRSVAKSLGITKKQAQELHDKGLVVLRVSLGNLL
jgi:RNA polymerase sigma factor (sigma-70 family)